jgi:hypothetical protein
VLDDDVTQTPAPASSADCQGNPEVRTVIDLGEPLGTRTLLDASSYPPVTVDRVVWTDPSGVRVPASTVLEQQICGNPAGPRTLRLAQAGVFTNDAGTTYAGRMLTSFAAHVSVPATARQAPYLRNKSPVWIARDGRAVYIGTARSVERWARLKNDDESVIDCN